jgi:hypothetical protein
MIDVAMFEAQAAALTMMRSPLISTGEVTLLSVTLVEKWVV